MSAHKIDLSKYHEPIRKMVEEGLCKKQIYGELDISKHLVDRVFEELGLEPKKGQRYVTQMSLEENLQFVERVEDHKILVPIVKKDGRVYRDITGLVMDCGQVYLCR